MWIGEKGKWLIATIATNFRFGFLIQGLGRVLANIWLRRLLVNAVSLV